MNLLEIPGIVEIVYENGNTDVYKIYASQYGEENLKNTVIELIDFAYDNEKDKLALMHSEGLSIISNKNLRSVKFNKNLFEILNMNKKEINYYFGVDLGVSCEK